MKRKQDKNDYNSFRSQFVKLGKTCAEPGDWCCPLRLKTGVQVIGGVLALLSGAVLVLFFAKLDDIVSRQYFKLFQVGGIKRFVDRP